MSFQEKITWGMLGTTIVVYAYYFATVFEQASNGPVADIDYQWLLVGTIITAIVISVISSIVIAVSNPAEADRTDERDRDIYRRASAIAFVTLSVLILGSLTLSMVNAEQFWIAQTILGALVVAHVVESGTRLFFYRRGF